MSRPRVVVIVSTMASSISAFLVLSRWQLFGTLSGAILLPLVYTFVGHWSSEGITRAGCWARHRVGLGESADEQAKKTVEGNSAETGKSVELGDSSVPARTSSDPDASADVTLQSTTSTTDGTDAEGDPEAAPGSARRSAWRFSRREWLLVGFATLALAMSVYSLAAPGPVERVIVEETVIQKTVTVTTEVEGSVAGSLLVASLDDGAQVDEAETASTGAETAGDQRDALPASGNEETSPTTTTETGAGGSGGEVGKDGAGTDSVTVDTEQTEPSDADSTVTTLPPQTNEDPGQNSSDLGESAQNLLPTDPDAGSPADTPAP